MEQKEYMNVSALTDDLFELYKTERDEYREVENSEFFDEEWDDDTLRQYAFEKAVRLDSNMDTYLHMKDTHIDGNFNNIRWDYPRENEGETFEKMVARLDANEQSERAAKDRDYLNAWFWETFGTFGLKYNFNDLLSNELSEWQEEHDLISA